MSKSKMLNAYILLDRSGSMANRWDEALSSINAYVYELVKGKTASKITAACFDAMGAMSFDILRDAVVGKNFMPLTNDDATPRGSTPLLDAIGRVVAMAEGEGHNRTVIVVMTDGYENASREVTREGAKAALDRCKTKDWQVVFLGADFDAFGQSASVGVAASHTLNMSAGNYGKSMRGLATQTACYAATGDGIGFTDKDREDAAGAGN